ncbi:MAG: hypothetical protein JSR91_05045 [Proteobacteria bacterium]|nr:hypothetical protein [Pseudomonadota bacterium]
MIWGKCRFEDADYAPYMAKLERLLMADVARERQYAMVSVEDETGEHYYVGVPDAILMRFFDDFEPVPESALPKEIDVLHVDAEAVQRLFKFKDKEA